MGSNPHFKVERDDLFRELSLTIGSVEKKNTIPILSHVLMTATEGKLKITATDLEICMNCVCDVKVLDEGMAIIPAKKLFDYVRLLPSGPVTVKVSDNNWATVTAGRARAKIAGMSWDAFPEVPTEGKPVCTMPFKAFARLVERVAFAISKEESRFCLNGSMLQIAGNELSLTATDGHRLAMASMKCSDAPSYKVLVPINAMNQLVKLAGVCALDATVRLDEDDSHLFFTVGDRVLTCRKMNGSYPDTEKVIPKSFLGKAVLERSGLRDVLQRVRGFSDERSHAIRMEIANGTVTVMGSVLEAGDSEEFTDAEVSGEKLVIGMNADYLLDFLNATESDKVVISYNTEKSAIQLTPETSSGKHICIVMPLRI